MGSLQDEGVGRVDEQWDGPSRRSLLRLGGYAVAGMTATGVGIAAAAALCNGDASAGAALGAPTGDLANVLLAAPATHPAPAGGARTVDAPSQRPQHEPLWMGTWKDPISRLDAHTAKLTGERFTKHAIMLTIDDGPHPVWTPRYLRLLARHHVSATFSVIGSQVQGNEHLLKAMVGEGHHIGNHTWHHPLNLPSLSAKAIRRELEDTTDAVVRAAGFRTRQFRAPGGVWGPDVFREVSRQQMMPLGWDIDPRDWAMPGVDEIRRAMLAARPHDVILCHDGGGDRSQTYHALKTVIPALLARGWSFVTLPAPQ